MPRNSISASVLAQLLGVSSRQAANICRSGSYGGHPIAVRTVKARGGKSGLVYQVEVASLPTELQARLKAPSRPAVSLADRSDEQPRELSWMIHYVAPLANLQGKPLAAAIAALEGTTVPDWRGGTHTFKRSTLRRWVKDYRENGTAALLRAENANKGKRLTKVSRAFERATEGHLDEAQLAALENAITLFIQGCWKDGATIGVIEDRLVPDELEKQAARLGFTSADKSVFRLNRMRLNRERHFAKVYRHKNDRKASEDARYRIERDASKLRPMEVVQGDVHHLNTPLLMADGREVWPCLITFVDLATQRKFSVVVVSPNKGAVRALDMIEAYKAMATDPSWGIPAVLYLDNGTENVFAEFVRDAQRLAWTDENGGPRRTVIHAGAYNAPAKGHVEGGFAFDENTVFKHMPGWSGDDRMNPKVPRLGGRHAPFSEGTEEYFRQVTAWQHTSNTHPRKTGHLKGDTPEERFAKWVDGEMDGTPWQAVVASEEGFNMAFSERTKVKLTKQTFKLQNRKWTNDQLKQYHGDWCVIYKPKFHKFNAVLVEDLEGRPLGIAEPDEIFDFLDTRGIENSTKSRKLYYEGLRQLAQAAPTIDTAGLLIANARKQPPAAPNPPRAIVRVSMNADPLLAFSPRPATPEDVEQDEAAARAAHADDVLARLGRARETAQRLTK